MLCIANNRREVSHRSLVPQLTFLCVCAFSPGGGSFCHQLNRAICADQQIASADGTLNVSGNERCDYHEGKIARWHMPMFLCTRSLSLESASSAPPCRLGIILSYIKYIASCRWPWQCYWTRLTHSRRPSHCLYVSSQAKLAQLFNYINQTCLPLRGKRQRYGRQILSQQNAFPPPH